MSQPAVPKHLKVVGRAGLVARGIDRQRGPARLDAAPMVEAVRFLATFHAHWGGRLDALDDVLKALPKDISDD